MAVSYANEQKWNDFLKAHGIRVLEADRWAGEHMMSWSDFAHHHPLGSMAHDDYLPLFADFFRSRSPGARRMTNAQIARLMRQHKQANPYIRDQDDSRAKAEAAYERADRAYTKAVETYGGFDDRTVAAYRRRQKAEQALHAILRRNPGDYEQRLAQAEQNRGQLFRSLRGKTKQELLGILSQQYRIHGMSAKDSITDLKYAITSAAFPDPRRPRRNPGKYVFGGHDFTEETYPKSLFPWEVAYTKTLAGMPEAGIPDMPVDESLAFIDERSARQWAESPRVLKAGYRPYAIRRRNPGKASFFSVYYRSLLELGMSPVNAREAVKQAKKANLTESDKRAVAKGLEAALKHKFGIRNPGLTPAGKKHLIQTMHKAGADTFRKKVAYVRRHIPNVTDPQAFVGYVMAGERKGKRR